MKTFKEFINEANDANTITIDGTEYNLISSKSTGGGVQKIELQHARDPRKKATVEVSKNTGNPMNMQTVDNGKTTNVMITDPIYKDLAKVLSWAKKVK